MEGRVDRLGRVYGQGMWYMDMTGFRWRKGWTEHRQKISPRDVVPGCGLTNDGEKNGMFVEYSVEG